ncbi:MAG: ABC transporter permease [Pseudorhodoplanes sp.]|uniref:ABC transporter permease n=1 Tax=Pseudorhodoplanes sp. TaxID=1934341 RepID=UPI003D0B5060
MAIAVRNGGSDAAGAGPLLIAPAYIFLAAAFVAPLSLLFSASLYDAGQLSLLNYRTALSDIRSLHAVGNTMQYGLLVTLGCFVIGLPTAIALTHSSARMQRLMLIIILLPMASSIVIKSFGWMILFRRTGVINQTLLWLGLVSDPVALLFTRTGLVLATIGLMLPFMVLPVYAVLKQIPEHLDDAAATLGAWWGYRFTRVTLPLAAPGISVGAALVFAHTVSAYLIPTLLGGSRHEMLSMSIVDSYLAFNNAGLGATYSVMLLALVGIALGLSSLFGRRTTS